MAEARSGSGDEGVWVGAEVCGAAGAAFVNLTWSVWVSMGGGAQGWVMVAIWVVVEVPWGPGCPPAYP